MQLRLGSRVQVQLPQAYIPKLVCPGLTEAHGSQRRKDRYSKHGVHVRSWATSHQVADVAVRQGSPGAHRELHSNLGDRHLCYYCFRRNTPDDPRHACFCTEASQFGLHEEMEQGALTAGIRDEGALSAGIRDGDALLEPGQNEDKDRLNVDAVKAAEERLSLGGDGGAAAAAVRAVGGEGGRLRGVAAVGVESAG